MDEVGGKGAVRGCSQSSSPRIIGKADNGCEARRRDGDGSQRTKAVDRGANLIAATFATLLFIICSIVEGEIVVIGSIRIYDTVAERTRDSQRKICVARHVPTRQDGAEAIHRQSVIGSARDSAASMDEVGGKGAVRGYRAPVWGKFDTGASPYQ